jgi:hypothetical protein
MPDSTYQHKPNRRTPSPHAAETGRGVHPACARRPGASPLSPESLSDGIPTPRPCAGRHAEARPKQRPQNPWSPVPTHRETGRTADQTVRRPWGVCDLTWAQDVTGTADGRACGLTADDRCGGGDVDHGRDPRRGELRSGAEAGVPRVQCPAEIRPSGTAWRMRLRGRPPATGCRRGGREGSGTRAFLTWTGHHLPDPPTAIGVSAPLPHPVGSLMVETWHARARGVNHA